MMQHHVSFCNAVIMVVLRYVSVKLFTALGRGTVPPLTVITSNLRKMRPLVWCDVMWCISVEIMTSFILSVFG